MHARALKITFQSAAGQLFRSCRSGVALLELPLVSQRAPIEGRLQPLDATPTSLRATDDNLDHFAQIAVTLAGSIIVWEEPKMADAASSHRIALTPGDFLRHPLHPEWGLGQVQSVTGTRIIANFEHRGKLLIDGAVVGLTRVALGDGE